MSNRFLHSLFFLFLSIFITRAQENGEYDVISHRVFIKLYPTEHRVVVNDTLKIRVINKLGDEVLMIVGTLKNTGHLFEIARRDSFEMDKAGWWIKIKPDSAVTLADLQNDRVFIYGKISENRIADDMLNKFPIRVAGDAVTIEGKNYIDSLAVIQIIENPYRDQGLMCWIVPLTNNSFPHLLPHDASYAVVEKKEVVEKGTWVIKDEDLVVEIK